MNFNRHCYRILKSTLLHKTSFKWLGDDFCVFGYNPREKWLLHSPRVEANIPAYVTGIPETHSFWTRCVGRMADADKSTLGAVSTIPRPTVSDPRVRRQWLSFCEECQLYVDTSHKVGAIPNTSARLPLYVWFLDPKQYHYVDSDHTKHGGGGGCFVVIIFSV